MREVAETRVLFYDKPMIVSAKTLFEELQTLPFAERQAFAALFHRWEDTGQVKEPEPPVRPPVFPDFMARLKEDFPNGVPGKPASEIVDEGRGSRP